jgi:ABC-2 type transport system ATP-binding protein
VLLCSHDIGELELLADWVGFLDAGAMGLSEPMDVFRERFKRVDVVLADPTYPLNGNVPAAWLGLERAGARVSFVLSHPEDGSIQRLVSAHLAGASRIDVRGASMREVFVALARHGSRHDHEEVSV